MSLRPTSLNKLVKVLNTLNALGTSSLAELSSVLGTSSRHVKELIKLLRDLGLVSFDGEVLKLTEEGREFIVSYASRNADYIDAVLSRIEDYRKSRECFEAGLSKPLDIAKCAGLNMVVADITLRLIKEVNALRELNNQSNFDPTGFETFERMLREVYMELARVRKNKYVPIYDLMNSMSKKLGLKPKAFTNLLAKLVREQRGRIMLISSPSLVGHPFVEVDGRRYTYLIFLDR